MDIGGRLCGLVDLHWNGWSPQVAKPTRVLCEKLRENGGAASFHALADGG
jgi:hypothetical protein